MTSGTRCRAGPGRQRHSQVLARCGRPSLDRPVPRRSRSGRSISRVRRRPVMAHAGHTGQAQVTVPPVRRPVPGGAGCSGAGAAGNRVHSPPAPWAPGAAGTRRPSAAAGRRRTPPRPGRGHARETRCRHQRRTRAMPGSRSCRHALMRADERALASADVKFSSCRLCARSIGGSCGVRRPRSRA